MCGLTISMWTNERQAIGLAWSATLGFPRIGARRELKRAVEAYWNHSISREQLLEEAAKLRLERWTIQRDSGIDLIPSNDFSLYDHVLDTAVLVGAIPEQFGWDGGDIDLDLYFAMARGGAVPALEMTKWFDTNYHYIVPEFTAHMNFRLASSPKPIDEFREALGHGIETVPVVLGPITFLLLGKAKGTKFDPLSLLPQLLPMYEDLLTKLAEAGARWVQLDEPCLALDRTEEELELYRNAYTRLTAAAPISIFLTTYFAGLRDNLATALSLPVAALHLDLVRAPEQLDELLANHAHPGDKRLSLGVVDGRNVWKNDLEQTLQLLERVELWSGGNENLIVAPSCSLLHVPWDLDAETDLDADVKDTLAFAKQKLSEIRTLQTALNEGTDQVAQAIADNRRALARRRSSPRIHNPEVTARLARVGEGDYHRRSPFPVRKRAQQARLKLPKFPTTTIGSFPQTEDIRKARAAFRRGDLSEAAYTQMLKDKTAACVRLQEQLGIDVLVHGEFERTDMVEYFGEQLDGFAHTRNGWVQSYGSRCVKPPIIYGDVARKRPMTVEWSRFAQSLTERPMKGMLTGPVTILQWSFVRDDQPRETTCRQIALAIRDEVVDLEEAGLPIIQIDEPALREGLPLHREAWTDYLAWAVDCFRLAASGVRDETQIHTHMCYAQFNDIMSAIAAMDADVISIETSRSDMELLEAFQASAYPNDIGPGVYDIHSPRVPTVAEMVNLLKRACERLAPEQLWVNPDCGLKTRGEKETVEALTAMVEAARQMRKVSSYRT